MPGPRARLPTPSSSQMSAGIANQTFGCKALLGYGAAGIWWGLAAGLFVTSILLSARLYLLMRTRTLDLRIQASLNV